MKCGYLECCIGCLNNSGGECDYEMDLEAEAQGCKLEDLVNDSYCSYADYYNEDEDID